MVLPEDRRLGLVGGAGRAHQRAHLLDLVEITRVGVAGEPVRRVGAQQRHVRHDERPDVAHPRRGIEREVRRRRPPDPRLGPSTNENGPPRPSPARSASIAAAAASPARDATGLATAVGDRGQGGVVARLQRGELRGEQRREHAVRGRRDRGLLGVRPLRGRGHEIRPMRAVDRVDGVIDGALDHRVAQARRVRRLPRRGHDRGRGDRVPVADRVGLRGRRREQRRDARQQAPISDASSCHGRQSGKPSNARFCVRRVGFVPSGAHGVDLGVGLARADRRVAERGEEDRPAVRRPAGPKSSRPPTVSRVCRPPSARIV